MTRITCKRKNYGELIILFSNNYLEKQVSLLRFSVRVQVYKIVLNFMGVTLSLISSECFL